MMEEQRPAEVSQPMIRGAIRAQWASVAAAWGQWEPYFGSSSWPVRQRLMTALNLKPGMRVLDIGCGIGEPTLPIAAAVGPDGTVVGIDLVLEMIELATNRARALDLQNVDFRVGAIEDLNEPVGSFDAVVSQFTIMFLEDVQLALSKARDLLRPGGRMAISVWAPMSVNPMFAIPRAQFAAVGDAPRPPADVPGPLRLSRDGELQQALEDAGFANVEVVDVKFYNFARSREEYFELTYALTPMFRRNYDALTADQQHRFRAGLIAALAPFEDSTGVRVPAQSRVGWGEKPRS
jgi:2-polyprenyl-3-methyl-5-hydroxy-6-metoxy-1,4-benzoquinol methylase